MFTHAEIAEEGSLFDIGKECEVLVGITRLRQILLNLGGNLYEIRMKAAWPFSSGARDGPADRHAGFRRARQASCSPRASFPLCSSRSFKRILSVSSAGGTGTRPCRARVLVHSTWAKDNPCAQRSDEGSRSDSAPLPHQPPQSSESRHRAGQHARAARRAPGPARRG